MDEMRQLSEELARLRMAIDRIESSRGNSNQSTVSINAGGPALWVAVWFSTLACAVMLTIAMLSRNDLVDQSRRLDLANDKLSIILQWAPELKNIVDKQIQQQQKDK